LSNITIAINLLISNSVQGYQYPPHLFCLKTKKRKETEKREHYKNTKFKRKIQIPEQLFSKCEDIFFETRRRSTKGELMLQNRQKTKR